MHKLDIDTDNIFIAHFALNSQKGDKTKKVGGVTVAIDLETKKYGVSVCAPRDLFVRKGGVIRAVGRIHKKDNNDVLSEIPVDSKETLIKDKVLLQQIHDLSKNKAEEAVRTLIHRDYPSNKRNGWTEVTGIVSRRNPKNPRLDEAQKAKLKELTDDFV
jgi:hypothetical protein